MSNAVLELNDQAVSLYVDAELVSSSPGYVLALGGQAQFGQQAAEQSRLHPVNTNNEFWYRLSMEPLRRPLVHFRHYADIAHAHLMHLAQLSSFKGDVAVVVPGSFSREQLGILSGVLKQSPFNATAMLDSALLSAAERVPPESALIVADLQLHQFSLTRLSSTQNQLRRQAVAVVQGAGWSNLANALVQVITDAFIEQSRFNPQHSAAWEQHLYNQLPDYLSQLQQGQTDLQVQIQTDKATHQARISASELTAALEPLFRKISQQLQQLNSQGAATDSPPVLLSSRAAIIPGLSAWLQTTSPSVDGREMAWACAEAIKGVTANGAAVPYITALRQTEVNSGPSRAASAHADIKPATHLLLGHDAYGLHRPCVVYRGNDGALVVSYDGNRSDSLLTITPSTTTSSTIASSTEAPQLVVNADEVLVNDRRVSGQHALVVGDRVTVQGSPTVLQTIRVCDVQG